MTQDVTRKEEDDLKRVMARLGDGSLPLDGLEQVIKEGDIIAYFASNGYPETYRIAKVLKIKTFPNKYRMGEICNRVVVRSVYVYRSSQGQYRPPQLSKRCASLESLHKAIVVKPEMVRDDILAMLSKVV